MSKVGMAMLVVSATVACAVAYVALVVGAYQGDPVAIGSLVLVSVAGLGIILVVVDEAP